MYRIFDRNKKEIYNLLGKLLAILIPLVKWETTVRIYHTDVRIRWTFLFNHSSRNYAPFELGRLSKYLISQPLNRISCHIVVKVDIQWPCAYWQGLLIWFFFWENIELRPKYFLCNLCEPGLAYVNALEWQI